MEQQPQANDNDGTAAVPEQSARHDDTNSQEQQSVQDNNTPAFAQSLQQNNGISLPQPQSNDPNGVNLGLGLGHFDPNGLILPTQGMNFGAGTNGMVFPDPSMMMLAASQPLAMGNISAEPTNGAGNGISAGE